MSCFQRPAHGSRRSLRPVDANLHAVLRIAPSAEVPPTIIVSVSAIKGDEETLRPTGLRGFHFIRIVLPRLHIADIEFALHTLIRLFQHAARSGPRASVGLPFRFYGREIVVEDYRPSPAVTFTLSKVALVPHVLRPMAPERNSWLFSSVTSHSVFLHCSGKAAARSTKAYRNWYNC